MNYTIHFVALLQWVLIVWFERKILPQHKWLKWVYRIVEFIQLIDYGFYIYAVSVSNPGGWADLIFAVLFLYGGIALLILSLFILIYRRLKPLK